MSFALFALLPHARRPFLRCLLRRALNISIISPAAVLGASSLPAEAGRGEAASLAATRTLRARLPACTGLTRICALSHSPCVPRLSAVPPPATPKENRPLLDPFLIGVAGGTASGVHPATLLSPGLALALDLTLLPLSNPQERPPSAT